LSYQFELFLLAVTLYLYDSTILLYVNEAILSCDRFSIWRVSTGSNEILVAGRKVCFLSPLSMFRPSVKLWWNMDSQESPGADESWSSELPKLQALAPWTAAATFGLFVLLPLGLFTPLGTYAILPAVLVLYGSILLALVSLRRHCPLSALTALRFAGLAFECLACPPFGLNLVRRAALMCQVREPLLLASERLLPPAEWDKLRLHCVASMGRQMGRLEETSAEWHRLEQRRASLSAWVQRR
jgi:hypothetical protein